jgi:hypothetical protein
MSKAKQEYEHMLCDAIVACGPIQGYIPEEECGTGCITWQKPIGSVRIYATPFWEGKDNGISVEVHIFGPDFDLNQIEEECQELKMKCTYSLYQDIVNYRSIMEDYLSE